MKKDPFCHYRKGEELLGLGVSYLSSIDAFMYLANYTHLNINFSANLLVRCVWFHFNPKTLELYQTYIALHPRNNCYEFILLKGIKATIAWIC